MIVLVAFKSHQSAGLARLPKYPTVLERVCMYHLGGVRALWQCQSDTPRFSHTSRGGSCTVLVAFERHEGAGLTHHALPVQSHIRGGVLYRLGGGPRP